MAKITEASPIAFGSNVSYLFAARLIEYDRLMRQMPEEGRKAIPQNCEECPYYHPDWKYRMCLYTKCRYGKVSNVFLSTENVIDYRESGSKER